MAGAQPVRHLVDGGSDRDDFLGGLLCGANRRSAAGYAFYRAVWRPRFIHGSDTAVRARCQTRAVIGALLATAILLACGTMFPRMFLVASMLNPALLQPLLLPALAMALVVYLPALWFWRETRRQKLALESPLKNPFELGPALVFGALLAAVMLLGEALRHAFGDAGLLALSAASGITDVDAITLSLSRMSTTDVTVPVAVLGIIIAAAANTLAKAAMAAGVGGRAVGLRVAGVLSASAFAGLGVATLGQA